MVHSTVCFVLKLLQSEGTHYREHENAFLSEEEVVGSLYVVRLVLIYTVLYSLIDGVASTMMVLSLIGIVNGYMC